MAAFDTAITPAVATPANTSDAVLFTASADTSVLVDVANIGAAVVAVRVGIAPGGGTTHWKVYDVEVPVGNALASLGPWFLQSTDEVTVRTDTANDAVFSLTGVETTP